MPKTNQKKKIIIDEEFKALLPALDKKTFEQLEVNIIENGCRDSLVLWNGILIDGHNRYAICEKHGIEYKTIDMEFDSREEVIIWIIQTQVSRRNLTPMQLSYYRGLHYKSEKQIITNKSGKNGRSEVGCHFGNQPPEQERTVNKLSQKYKVSPRTIVRDLKTAELIDAIGESSPEAKQKILSGESSINKRELEILSYKPKEKIEEAAEKIKEGTYEKENPKAEEATVDFILSNFKPIDSFMKKITRAFESELEKITESGDRTKIKAALRVYIKAFEKLYKQV